MSEKIGIFGEQICSLRAKSLKRRKKLIPNKAIASWIEEDRLIQEIGKSLVIIMNSSGCSWSLGEGGGCSMCGYSNDTSEKISTEDFIEQIEKVLENNKEKDFKGVKLFNSGSFLDENEIPIEAQNRIISMLSELPITEIVIETRPEFVTAKVLKRITSQMKDNQKLELGIGLESSSDFVRINYINKGFLFEDFKKSVQIAIENNVRVKSYLLFKPILLTEKEAIDDIIQSVIDSIKAGARSISINPLNIQNGTLAFELWDNKLYRSPWFWSLEKALKEISERIEKEGLKDKYDRIVSDPSGAGSRRGIHNCKKCDKIFIKAIKKFTLTQKLDVFNIPKCSCYSTWEEFLEYEEGSADQSLSLLEKAQNYLS